MLPKTNADLLKGLTNQTSLSSTENTHKSDTYKSVDAVFEYLCTDANSFDELHAFTLLNDYIVKYERLLYAPLSHRIYKWHFEHKEEDDNDIAGTIQTNIEKVFQYIEDSDKEQELRSKHSRFEDTKKVFFKIRDHVNLAEYQYEIVQKSTGDYASRVDEKFKEQEKVFAEQNKESIVSLTKEMNGQLLTLVGIFTALAFLVFGGITSLDNIFSTHGIPLLKLMVICSLWGLTIINLVFVFLICVSKMTKITIKSTEESTASVFQKYPIVWWTNLLLCSILALLSWLYFVRQNHALDWFKELCLNHPARVSCGGFLIIGVITAIAAWILLTHTKTTK